MGNRFISWAELEASALVRGASGCVTNDPDQLDRDVEYILVLASRIRDARLKHAADAA